MTEETSALSQAFFRVAISLLHDLRADNEIVTQKSNTVEALAQTTKSEGQRLTFGFRALFIVQHPTSATY